MLDDLLKLGKITRFHYLSFAIFECTEFGREFLSNMLVDTFMEEPTTMDGGGTEFVFIDGRRSSYRDIRRAVLFVKKKLQEVANDSGKSE